MSHLVQGSGATRRSARGTVAEGKGALKRSAARTLPKERASARDRGHAYSSIFEKRYSTTITSRLGSHGWRAIKSTVIEVCTKSLGQR